MDWFEPMEPILTDSIMKGEQWIHQVKWDGIRGLCYKDGNSVHIYTKSGRERSQWYPEVTGRIMQLNCRQAVFDGELIVLDDSGRPSFHDMMSRDRVKRQDRLKKYIEKYPVQYMVFDILYKDGEDLRKSPLSERRKILLETLKSDGPVQVVSDYTDGEALFLSMKEMDMEGIVSKKADSPYVGGKKHRMWFKTKIIKKLIAVVCGLKIKDNEVKSLVIAEYQNGSLVPIGSVSSGLSGKDRMILLKALPQLKQDTPLFKNTGEVIWIKPVLNVIVSFIEREQNGSLRHPVLVGFTDESPKRV
ncbi:MAG TPA: non-homologous end-joining DNA ligase [Thermoclostridium sp.]